MDWLTSSFSSSSFNKFKGSNISNLLASSYSLAKSLYCGIDKRLFNLSKSTFIFKVFNLVNT